MNRCVIGYVAIGATMALWTAVAGATRQARSVGWDRVLFPALMSFLKWTLAYGLFWPLFLVAVFWSCFIKRDDKRPGNGNNTGPGFDSR
jgi:hypothetical protein